MKNTLLRLCLAVSVLILAACESSVRTQIQTFRNDQLQLPDNGTIHIEPQGKEKESSLEFEFYRKKLAQRFEALGLSVVNKDQADYIATLAYRVSRQEKDRPHSRVYVSGYWGRYPRSGLIVTDDLGPGYEFVRELSLTIDENDASPPKDQEHRKVIQVLASSEGACQHLSVVYDEMLDAIFSNLWRANGSLVSLTVKGDAKCP